MADDAKIESVVVAREVASPASINGKGAVVFLVW